MKKTSLLIMAAGLGSRFGGGVKQLEPVGMHDEIIMDYSIHDAIEAGFNKIIFVIRRDIEADFRERIGERIEKICGELGVETAYAFQNMSNIPEGFSVPEGRTKPWGTCHAVLAAKEYINEPFMVINADDYYGKDAYKLLHDWLIDEHEDSEISMAGFILKNTLSENGGVTRGICVMNASGDEVCDVKETRHVIKTPDGAEADGVKLNPQAHVSMNMWGFPARDGEIPKFMSVLEDEFVSFFTDELPADPQKAEYLLPTLIGSLLRRGEYKVRLLETHDKWFGVTYKEDKDEVAAAFKKLIENGEYGEWLYEDLK